MAQESSPRERLLATAARLFYSQGYAATGINQILAEARVAKASLYLHYKSKDELGLEYMKFARQEWFRALNAFLEKKSTPQDKLLGCFDFVAQSLQATNYHGCRFLNLLPEVSHQNQAIREQIVAHKVMLRGFMHGLVQPLLAPQGADDAQLVADQVYLLFEGALTECKLYRDLWPLHTARGLAATLVGRE